LVEYVVHNVTWKTKPVLNPGALNPGRNNA